jgi:hypothetical protein
MGPQGPAGTTGATGPAGPSSGLTFLISGVTPLATRWWTGTGNFFSYYSVTSSGEEPARGAPMPMACDLSTITMYASTNKRSPLDNGDSVTLTIYKNNLPTLMTCTAMSTTNLHEAVSVTCTSNPVSLAVGDTLGLQWSHSNTSSTLFTQYGAGLRCL